MAQGKAEFVALNEIVLRPQCADLQFQCVQILFLKTALGSYLIMSVRQHMFHVLMASTFVKLENIPEIVHPVPIVE